MQKRIIFCDCKGEIIDVKTKESVHLHILSKEVDVIELSDICGLATTDKDSLKKIVMDGSEVLFLACHPRAVTMLLGYAGLDTASNWFFEDMRSTPVDLIKNRIDLFLQENSSVKILQRIESDPSWPSWFPVIDYTRCTSCGQCADFCLFGVYEKIEETVKVVNPKGCKNNCPACARICPQIAIVFPKYNQDGAISGSDSFDELTEQHRQVADMEKILGGDVYKALEERKKKRQSIIKADVLRKAMEERDIAMKQKK